MKVILVTGGNGFVGQHFIKHIQLYGPPTLREIRVLDERTFEKKLDYNEHVIVRCFTGSVFDEDVLEEALNGVDTVVHLAELKDTSMLPDSKEVMRINVKGTKAIVDACISHPSVKRFLLLSSGDIMLANQLACDANVTEIWPIPETNWVYPDYCRSKYEAEKIVFSCEAFQSFAARLGPLYGELDDQEWGFSAQLKLGKRFNGVLPVLGDRKGVIMHTYVGNAAYGMVKVLEKMIADPTATGEAVFLLDETPLTDFYSLLEPYAKAKSYRLSTMPIWFVIFFTLYWILEKFAQWTTIVQCLGLKSHLKKLPCARVLYNYCYTYITFSAFKSVTYVGYRRLYSYDAALANSTKYYESV